MRFVPIGVLAALVWPQVLSGPGQSAPRWPVFPGALPELLATALTALVAYRTRSILLPVLAGVGTVVAVRMLTGWG